MPIGANCLDQRRNGCRVAGADEERAEVVFAVVVGADLVQVTPDLAVERRLPSIHNSDDQPIALAEAKMPAQLRIRIALCNGLADDDLPMPRLKPSAAHQVHVSHRNANREEAAQCDVHALGVIHAGQIDHLDHFERRHRLVGVSLAIPLMVRNCSYDSRETELPSSELPPLRRTRI